MQARCQVLCCPDQWWLRFYFLGSRPFSLPAYWNLPLIPRPTSFGLGTSKIGAILLLLFPKLFIFSCPLSGTRHHQPRPPSHISHCYCQLAPVWCLVTIYVYQVNRDTASWMVQEPDPPALTLPRISHHGPCLAVVTALHLVLLTHFMTLKSDPDPDHGPRGAWWKVDGESKGMLHSPLHCEIYALFITFTNDTKQMSHLTRRDSRPFSAWVSPWFLELDIFQGVLAGHKSRSNNKMIQR